MIKIDTFDALLLVWMGNSLLQEKEPRNNLKSLFGKLMRISMRYLLFWRGISSASNLWSLVLIRNTWSVLVMSMIKGFLCGNLNEKSWSLAINSARLSVVLLFQIAEITLWPEVKIILSFGILMSRAIQYLHKLKNHLKMKIKVRSQMINKTSLWKVNLLIFRKLKSQFLLELGARKTKYTL